MNIDHVATLRNARGGDFPCPVAAAKLAIKAGADGITAHLREDRRHIRDRDIERLKAEISAPLNFEMAATDEMLTIALRIKPHAVCLVPEKREELTTEGGLDVYRLKKQLEPFIAKLTNAGIRVSLFIDADEKQLITARELKAPIVEIHTGAYANGKIGEYEKIISAVSLTNDLELECHAGHGLNFANMQKIVAINRLNYATNPSGISTNAYDDSQKGIKELNIGHFLIGESIFTGLESAVKKMLQLMGEGK